MKRIIASRTNDTTWWKEYYDEVSAEQLAAECGCDTEDITDSSAEYVQGYDAKHVSWLIAKPKYVDRLDSYDTAELVNEGGDIFVAFTSGGRIYDIKSEVLAMVSDD